MAALTTVWRRRWIGARRHLLAGLGALVLGACSVAERPAPGPPTLAPAIGELALFDEHGKPKEAPAIAAVGLPKLAGTSRGSDLTVLAISGGGSDGAFGAGVLKGWTESGRRPIFDIVTGVSTGALIASFAFLGREWDGELERFYTRITEEQIYERRGIAGLFEDSLYDTAPLRRMIENVVTDRLLKAVAAEHVKGRRLYVATTDLDAGTSVVWDLGGIAASNQPDRLERYRDVLVASSAFPGFFKPVFVRNADNPATARMHVDGGVKAPVLLRSFMLGGPQQRKTVYLLINGKLTLRAEAAAVKPTVLDISQRSIAELMRGLTYKTIYQAYVTTRQARADFKLLYVPDHEKDIEEALRFQPREMRRLFEIGRRIGADPGRWLAEPPRLEPLERIAPRR